MCVVCVVVRDVCVVGVWCGTRSAGIYLFAFLQKFCVCGVCGVGVGCMRRAHVVCVLRICCLCGFMWLLFMWFHVVYVAHTQHTHHIQAITASKNNKCATHTPHKFHGVWYLQ